MGTELEASINLSGETESIMNGRLEWKNGELKFLISLSNGDPLIEIHDGNKDFDALLDLVGLAEVASLLRIGHDLTPHCGCDTCQTVRDIQDKYR